MFLRCPEPYEEHFLHPPFSGDFIPDGEDANNKQFLTYYLTPEGGNKLRRVLCVIKHLNPDITYCPLLEPIISILLHYFDEEETFSVVSGLLSGSFSAPFMDQTKIENVTTDATLQDLFLKVNVCTVLFFSLYSLFQSVVYIRPFCLSVRFIVIDFGCSCRMLPHSFSQK